MSRYARYARVSAAVFRSRRSRRAKLIGSSLSRRLSLERLESRYLLAGDLLNSFTIADPSIPLDDGGESEGIVLTSPAIPPDFNRATATGADDVATAAAFALDQTFLLHSNPGATKVIYLDFDGHTTSGQTWNTNYNDGADFTTPAYSYQGDSSTFTDAELLRIQRIWERVKEDFLPFDVNVTTQDPGVDNLRKSGLNDTRWGIRVVIGGSWEDWYGSSAGGVANVGSFDASVDRPCYVFTKNLNNGNEKSTAEAISHEAGHTLDLSHDGTSGDGAVTYYRGHGSGATGWAPIMGVGYDRQLAQWSKGEYPAANQTQDDLSRITTRNGFGYRTDDHSGTRSAATPLSISSTVVFNEGIIERTTDLDYFSFSTIGGVINLDIDPFYLSPNLDILATLYNSSGSIIATSNPVSALDANFSMTLGPGTYYVSIDGTGKPANGTDYGYSDYGSLGYYSISGTIVDTASPGIELYGTSFTATPSSLFVANGFIDASFALENNGTVTAPAFDVKFYLSDDATIDPANDLLLTLDPASAFYDSSEPSAYHVAAGLATFGVHSKTVRLTVPVNDPFVTDNQYFVGMFVDADGNAAESNETNNRNRGLGIDRQQVTYAPAYFNSTAVAIPASGSSTPYPSNIVISGVVGSVLDVNVSLFGITHTNPDDLDLLLVGPAGQKVIILSDAGGTGDLTGVDLVLDDQATNFLSDTGQLVSGTFKPTNFVGGDAFSSPAPAGPYASLLSTFLNTIPNGTWSLYVLDDAASNSGSIVGGWGLSFAIGNAAPTNPTNVPLATIQEDISTTDNLGRSIASIVAASGSVDSEGASMGVALTSASNFYGQWQYSTSGGSGWQNIVGVSLSAARLLAPTDYLRFVPNADFNTQIAAAPGLGFKVWDQTSGTAGGTSNTTTGSAFSAGAALITQVITPVNDAPSFLITESQVVVQENSDSVSMPSFASSIASGPATATDEVTQTREFVLVVTNITGSLSFTDFPAVDPVTGELVFVPTAGTYGTATFDIILVDNGAGTPPNVNESAAQQFTIEVIAAVNEEQVLAVNAGLTVEQGAGVAITTAMLETTDADNVPSELVYMVTAGPSHGMILVDGLPVTLFSQAQIDAGVVAYQNDGASDSADSFEFTVDDGEGAVIAGTFAITVRPFAGDFNRDLVVDAADFVVWRKSLETTGVAAYSGADGDGDGTIGPGDYDVWRAHFGATLLSVEPEEPEESGEGESAGAMVVSESASAVGDAAVVGNVSSAPVQSLLSASGDGTFGLTIPYLSRAAELIHVRPWATAAGRLPNTCRDDALVAWLAAGTGDRGRVANDIGSPFSHDASKNAPSEDEFAVCDDIFESLAAGFL